MPKTSTPAGTPGAAAEKPQDIPKRGWFQIAKRGWAEAKSDNVPLLAAGVAFYTFLAIFPAMIALVLIYGLIADPAQISSQIDALGSAVPDAAKSLIQDNLVSLTERPTATGWGLVAAVALALWSASGGMNNMMLAISLAYDEEQKRSFIKQRGLALLLTLGAIIVMVVMLGLVAVAPAVLDLVFTGALHVVAQILRWAVLVVVIVVALAVLYRVAPDRDAPKMRWVSVGAGVATLLWVLASIGFSIYAGFGGYAKTYGALAGIVVLLFWLWITSYAILLGAEINAESEQQTVKDTTKGPSAPLGERGAVKADSVPAGDDADHDDEQVGRDGGSDSTRDRSGDRQHEESR